MTYIETIKRGNKKYYYLTKNIRVDKNKWKKIRKYLGNKKPDDQEIKKQIEKIEKSSQKNRLSYLKNKDAEILEDIKEGYKKWLKNTPKNTKNKFYDDFVIRFTYNTNAIEGNRLTLRQTALILKDKVIPSGIRASDYQEAINGKECLEFLKKYEEGINNKFLERVNGILTKNTGIDHSGKIRDFEVAIEGSKHTPPDHKEVKRHLLNMYKWYSANKGKLHPFELAVLVHGKLAWIHPFEDGNGRTARATMNWILMGKDYPMFFIPYEKKEKYYLLLEEFDKNNLKRYVSGMLDLVIDQIKNYRHRD